MYIQWIDLTNLSTFSTDDYSFDKTIILNIESIYMSINDDSDVPFINGKYTHGNNAFFRLYSNHIQYDDSISFHSLLH